MDFAKELAEGGESVRELDEYKYEDLECITDGFNAENFIGETQFGKLFHGTVQRGFETVEVIVKMFIIMPGWMYKLKRQRSRLDLLENEKKLLTDVKFCYHQNLAKLIGYCIENEHLGTVYELKPRDTVHNLFPQDGFKWMGRIKVALEFARLLEFLHGRQIKLRNIDARHLVVDNALNPKLLDFSMISGGVFGEMPAEKSGLGCLGYVDPQLVTTGIDSGCDVYAYGVILLGLITKRPVLKLEERATLGQKIHLCYWAQCEYKELEGKHKSLVHRSLQAEPFYSTSDGVEITKLALQCVEFLAKDRPTIKEVVSRLKGLNVVQRSLLLGIPVMEDDGVYDLM